MLRGNKNAPKAGFLRNLQLDERRQRGWGMGCFANAAFTSVLALAFGPNDLRKDMSSLVDGAYGTRVLPLAFAMARNII